MQTLAFFKLFLGIFLLRRLCFQIEEDEKLKKRKERFGALTNAGSVGAADTEVCFFHPSLSRFTIITHRERNEKIFFF